VSIRKRSLLAALVGLWMAHAPAAPAYSQELPINPAPPAPTHPSSEPGRLGVDGVPVAPVPAISPNQRIADAIASNIRQNGQLRHYMVELTVRNGVVDLAGEVANQAQHDEVLRLVQAVPGVEHVRDHMKVQSAPGLKTAQALTPSAEAPAPRPIGSDAGMPQEPMPIFQGQPEMSPNMDPPRMPPYAWPTYAPYNNYSRVAYPMLYPYQAWPFIGPFNPFPKVPPGWRSITLTWQDGCWWYGKNATSHDWWRVRYW
jgi:hypothetical protein